MKVKLRDPVKDALRTIVARQHELQRPIVSLNTMKRNASLVEIVGQVLEQDPTWLGEEARFHCFRPQNHNNGDAKPSFWVRDEHHSGFPRCGCNVCGWADDVFGFLQRALSFTHREAVEWVADRLGRRSEGKTQRRIRVRLRRRSGGNANG